MAEKKVIELEIKSNLNVAEKQLKDLGNAIKIVDKEATNLDATFEEIYGDIKPLTAQMGELEDRLYELAKAGKQNTKEYQDLLREVGKYKRIQQETDKVVDAAAMTMSSKLSGSLNAAAGGFSLVQGSMALFGAESTQVEEAILKVQAAMAISQGVETIREGAKSFTALGNSVKSYTIIQKISAAAQYVWNAAMSANPIGLLVVAIAALIAGGVALVNYFKSSSEASAKNTASIKSNKTALESQSKAADSASKSLQTNSDYQLAMAKASGASTAAIRKLELKLIDEKIAFANSSREIAKNTYYKNLNALASLKASDADEEQIKSQEEITRKSLEEFGKQTKNLNDANAEKGNIIRKQNVEIRQEQTNHNNELRNKNKEASTKANEDAIAAKKEYIDKANAFDEENNLKAVDTDKIKKDTANASMISDLETKVAIGQNYVAEQRNMSAQEIADAQAVADAKKSIQESTFNNISSGIGLLKGLFEKNKGLQKALLIAESAAGIAKIIINTRAANAAAKSSAPAPIAAATSGPYTLANAQAQWYTGWGSTTPVAWAAPSINSSLWSGLSKTQVTPTSNPTISASMNVPTVWYQTTGTSNLSWDIAGAQKSGWTWYVPPTYVPPAVVKSTTTPVTKAATTIKSAVWTYQNFFKTSGGDRNAYNASVWYDKLSTQQKRIADNVYNSTTAAEKKKKDEEDKKRMAVGEVDTTALVETPEQEKQRLLKETAESTKKNLLTEQEATLLQQNQAEQLQ